jgi:hypothetical protein
MLRSMVGVFENRIEDRKPLRVLFSVLGWWAEFRTIFRPEHFFQGHESGFGMRVQNET